MTIKTRLQNIERNVKAGRYNDVSIFTLLKIENWKYEIGEKEMITFQEWEAYRNREMERSNDKSKTKDELDKLENKIRSQDGFMEIKFVVDENI